MIFEQTQRTPYVELTPQSCAIRGECYPENIAEWSGPVLESLEKSLELGSDTFVDGVEVESVHFGTHSSHRPDVQFAHEALLRLVSGA